MKRTKSRAVKLSPSDRNNIGTQTENFDSLIEVAKLEEQVRLLQLENNVLRQHAETSKPDSIVRKSTHLASQATPKINGEKSGCGCKKGNCSSRMCGCVKKNNKCNPSCKCDDKICQNQKKSEYDHENKENVNEADMETPKKQSTKRNGATERTRNNRGLFTPDMSKVYTDLEDGQYGDINFSFNDKRDPMTKNSQTVSHNTNKKKRKDKKEQEKKEQDKKEQDNKEQQQSTEKVESNMITNDIEIVIYDPMKPRHQLSRTPPNSKKLEKPEKLEKPVKLEKPEKPEKLEKPEKPEKPEKLGETIQPQLHCIPTREETVISPKIQDIKEERIDWDEHTAQLIPCKICKRTFMPERIQKHEACCKNI